MKRTLLTLFTLAILAVGCESDPAEDTTSAVALAGEKLVDFVPFYGAGTAEDPYLIENEEDLAFIVYRVYYGSETFTSGHYLLTQDITLEESWSPIGSTEATAFTGTFDGGNFTISNLTIGSSSVRASNYQSFIGYLGDGGEVCNLTIEGAIYASSSTGGIVGVSMAGSKIDNCTNYALINATTYTGGIVGAASGDVTNCINYGQITGTSYTGSIAGSANGELINCFNYEQTTGTTYTGGICGESQSSASLFNCWNKADITGTTPVGGVVGRNLGVMDYCDNDGIVIGTTTYIGGVAGINITDEDNRFVTAQMSRCANRGAVAASSNATIIGGVVGSNESIVTNSYNYASIGFASEDVTAITVTSVTLASLGGIAGSNAGTVSSCYCDETVTISGTSTIGGLIGIATETSTLEGSYNAATVLGTSSVGGLIGDNSGVVNNCTNYAAVGDSATTICGGIVGNNGSSTSLIINCVNESDINGDSYVAGIAGSNGEEASVINSYNLGTITATSGYNYSGIVGSNGGDIYSCYEGVTTNIEGVVGLDVTVDAGDTDSEAEMETYTPTVEYSYYLANASATDEGNGAAVVSYGNAYTTLNDAATLYNRDSSVTAYSWSDSDEPSFVK